MQNAEAQIEAPLLSRGPFRKSSVLGCNASEDLARRTPVGASIPGSCGPAGSPATTVCEEERTRANGGSSDGLVGPRRRCYYECSALCQACVCRMKGLTCAGRKDDTQVCCRKRRTGGGPLTPHFRHDLFLRPAKAFCRTSESKSAGARVSRVPAPAQRA